MPVSADPNVPDPASLHDSPMDSPKPVAAEESEDDSSDANTMIASAIPPNLYKNISGHRTVSGLFTPMSEASSYPPSPAVQDLSDDSAVETAEPAPETSTENSAASPVTDEPQAKDVSMSPHAEGSEPVKTGASDGTSAGKLVQVVTEPSADEPQEVVPPPAADTCDSVPLSPRKNEVDADEDADADGDVDPDYDTSIEVQESATASQLPGSAEPALSGGVPVIPETSSVDGASVVAEAGGEEPRYVLLSFSRALLDLPITIEHPRMLRKMQIRNLSRHRRMTPERHRKQAHHAVKSSPLRSQLLHALTNANGLHLHLRCG